MIELDTAVIKTPIDLNNLDYSIKFQRECIHNLLVNEKIAPIGALTLFHQKGLYDFRIKSERGMAEIAMENWEVAINNVLWFPGYGKNFFRICKTEKPIFKMPRVVIESPYTGTEDRIEKHLIYARRLTRWCIDKKRYAPVTSHLVYTQPGVLIDELPDERILGIDAGLNLALLAEASIVGTDWGCSSGMKYAIENANKAKRRIEIVNLFSEPRSAQTLIVQ